MSTDEELMQEAAQTLQDCAKHITQQNKLINALKEENTRLKEQVELYRARWNGTADEY